MRILIAALVGLGLGIAGASLVIERGDKGRGEIDVGSIPAPRLTGLSASEAECWMRRWPVRLIVDDEVSLGKPPRELCTGRMRIAPDPDVVRQIPFAGAGLTPGQPLRLYTECYGRRCL